MYIYLFIYLFIGTDNLIVKSYLKFHAKAKGVQRAEADTIRTKVPLLIPKREVTRRTFELREQLQFVSITCRHAKPQIHNLPMRNKENVKVH